MTLVVNFYGGPGVGKSTACAGVFAELKMNGINCEMAREFAKDVVWEESFAVLSNQIHVFGQQQHRLHRLIGKVDVVLTDSPLLLSLVYGQRMPPAFKGMVLESYAGYNNHNIYLKREKPYNPAGRVQTEDEAKHKDDVVYHILKGNDIPFVENVSNRAGILVMASDIMGILDIRGDSSSI